MKKRLILLFSLIFLTVYVFAAGFTVRKIEIKGLQRIQVATVYNYLPVKLGEYLTPEKSNKIIKSLYDTGFFRDVQLTRVGDTLIIAVRERPIIGRITISGNKLVKTKLLVKVLKQQGVAEGYEYNRSVLKNIKTALLDQYYAHGKYNARINIDVTPMADNRVAVDIVISEGLTAVIKQIKIIGNHAFDESELVDQFSLTTPGLLTWFTHDDQYSSAKLAGDLQHLKAFYQNRGYIRFKIKSSQVSLSPDRKKVYITVRVSEGAQYHFSGYSIGGKLILPRAELKKKVQIHKGQIYSKAVVISSQRAMDYALGDLGYYRAQIKAVPVVNDKNKTVFMRFTVIPGRQYYVRHISFVGNVHTNDFAFRRALLQYEGGLLSTKRVDDSKQNLLQMPFVTNVDVSETPVRGTNDQVDMTYHVKTVPAGEVKAGIGYDDVDGILLNAGLNQQNFFGTGNNFGFNVSYSASLLSANINYYNPYYTPWGVGRGFNIYASHYNADAANIADYATDNYGASLNYSVPISHYDSIQFGIGIDALDLRVGSEPSDEIDQFIQDHGKNFIQIPLNLSWTHNTLNRAVFPTHGFLQTLGAVFSAPVEKKSLEYYKASYHAVYYHPIYHRFIAKLRGGAGYGNGYGSYDRLPFFKNFYMGGLGSVRGYTANTIGPIDSNGDPLGGNLSVDMSAAVIFPNPFNNKLRTSVFVDAGNVYDTQATKAERDRNRDRTGLRYSTGLQVDWLSPLGMLSFSLAYAINPSKQDEKSPFQFSVGTSF